jgi:hypothetical protein
MPRIAGSCHGTSHGLGDLTAVIGSVAADPDVRRGILEVVTIQVLADLTFESTGRFTVGA